MQEQIKKLIAGGENQKVEFKKAKNDFPKDALTSICAFLNTDGGIILLGVEDDGTITGVNPNSVSKIKDSFVTLVNNISAINPTIYLTIEECLIENKTICYIKVPNASSVYRVKSRIYVRNYRSDMDITDDQDKVRKLYLRADNTYSENQIFPYLKPEELKSDLINKVKKIAKINNPQLDWDKLDLKEFLKRNKLYKTDYTNGEEGVTLASILLFGTDEQIASVAPSFKIELVKRINDTERYDDRITLTTNLIDCFDIAMKFVINNLPDSFYLEGIQRINLRNNIFREIIANMIVHKEYTGAEPTRLIITKDEIIAENSNRPRIRGIVTLENTTNYSKNPSIIKIFRSMGYVEDFGTGIPKLFKYCKEYTKNDPVIKDDDVFVFKLKHSLFDNTDQVSDQAKTNINKHLEQNTKNSDQATDQVSDQASDQVSDQVKIEKAILEFCAEAKSMKEIMSLLGYSSKNYFRISIIKPLLKKNLLKLTQPNSLNSPTQKYITVINNEDNNE